jgi:RimJ/RimL family protein N-acetyltransferase
MLPPFRTARLSMSRLGLRDVPGVCVLFASPAVTEWIDLHGRNGLSIKMAKALIVSQEPARRNLFGVRTADGTLAGAMLYKLLPSRDIEIGYVFGVDHQGKGYATEALRGMLEQFSVHAHLAEHRVVAQAQPNNKPSINVLRKAGFRPTHYKGIRHGRIGFAFERTSIAGGLDALGSNSVEPAGCEWR